MSKRQSVGKHEFSLTKKDSSPYYYVRLMHQGKRMKFSTGETTKRRANEKAAAIAFDLKNYGPKVALENHARRKVINTSDPLVDDFIEIARTIYKSEIEDPPTRTTYERNLRSLERICEATGVARISELTDNQVEEFKVLYRRKALETGRKRSSVDTTIRAILRNAAALFSKRMMKAYTRHEMEIAANPFADMELPKVKLKPYDPLPAGTLERICRNAQILKSGDPRAEAPKQLSNREYDTDYRKPQLGAYLLFILELGLGLRRNEADKCEWDWIVTRADGRHYLEVKETPYFIPKSRQSRIIPLPQEILDELLLYRRPNDSFMVPGSEAMIYKPDEAPRAMVYRCDDSHRALVKWLRAQGIDDKKPCHLLRKEYGSVVASMSGLFVAQRVLGHSSPAVTDAHYAGMKSDLKAVEDTGFFRTLIGGGVALPNDEQQELFLTL